MRSLFKFSLFVILISFQSILTQELKTVETEDIRIIYYDQEHEFIVNHLARCAVNALDYHKDLFDYDPDEKVTILLHDFNDYGGGGTSTIPWNFILLGMEPMDYVYETQPSNERMNWLMNHELVHVVATDKGNKSDHIARKFFSGKVPPSEENPVTMAYAFLTNPRRWSPRWYHEGIAVFLETWMAGGAGRVMGGYDEMMFRTMVKDSVYFYDFVGIESEGTTIDFQIGQVSYLYGTRFLNYLATIHGPEKLMQWFTRSDDSKRHFSDQFKYVYGYSIDEEWKKWIQFEKDFQSKNLDLVREFPVTPLRPLSNMALGSVSKSYYVKEKNSLLSAVLYPGSKAQIAEIDVSTGKLKKLGTVPTPALYYVTSLAFDHDSTLFYTTDNSRGWRDINTLNIYTGEVKEILKDFRTGDLTYNKADGSLWGVQHHNGISSLVMIPPPYKDGFTVASLEYGKDLVDIEISPDGSMIIGALLDVSGNQNLVMLKIEDLSNGIFLPEVLFDFENSSPASFTFSDDGKFIYGSSYYTGVSNIVRYNFETGDMEWLTNAETGLFRPVPVSKDSIVAFNFTGGGFLPVILPVDPIEDVNAVNYLGMQIVEKYPELMSWMLGPPSTIDLEEKVTFRGLYKPLKQMGLTSFFPIIEGYKNQVGIGGHLNIADPISLHSLDAAFSVTPESKGNERFHGRVKYSVWDWSFHANYNNADFYDLFGPTKTSRKGYSLGFSYSRVLLNEPPSKMNMTFGSRMYGGLETLPDFQNEAVDEGFSKYYNTNLDINFSHLTKTLGSIDYESGISAHASLSGNYVNENLFPKLRISTDIGIPMPVDHASLWIRTSAGKSFTADSSQFANFYFGGFGNNWVDVGSIERYREYYSFPGLALTDNDISSFPGGPAFGRVLSELVLPPVRFKRIGFPSLYGRWLKFSIFSSFLYTGTENLDIKFMNIGFQSDLKLVLFSTQEATFSIGYGVAKDLNDLDKTFNPEIMVSLKIL